MEVKSRAGDYTNGTVYPLLEQRGLLGRKLRYVSVGRGGAVEFRCEEQLRDLRQ